MNRYWTFILIIVGLALLLGTATVSNIRAQQPTSPVIVNLTSVDLSSLSYDDSCASPAGFSFLVPVDKELHITDVVIHGITTGGLWTSDSNVRIKISNSGEHLVTPLVINAGETLCPRRYTSSSDSLTLLVTGNLVNAP